MKYLKRYEIICYNNEIIDKISPKQKKYLKKYKYKIGDKVKLIQKWQNNTIFYINGIDIIENHKNDNVYCLYYLLNDKFFAWIKEEDIIPITDVEIAANKYNI